MLKLLVPAIWKPSLRSTVVAMRALGILVLIVLLMQGCTSAADLDSQAFGEAVSVDVPPGLTSTPVPAASAEPEPIRPGPTAEPTSTTAPTPSEIPTPSTEPTSTTAPTPSEIPTPSTEPTESATPAIEPAPSTTATQTPTPSEVPTPALTPAQTATPTATAAPAPTQTPQPTESALDENGEKGDLPPSDYAGDVVAIRTQAGVVVPVRAVTGDDYQVVTPCYNLASITGGLPIMGPIDVLIDPGHGGDEPGAVGPNGLKESTVNLRVSELLRAELLERGYRVELTRYSDHRVAIQARAELANAMAPTVFMSIHHNGGFPEPFPVAGTEVFVQLDDPESARLGGLVFQEIQRAFADIEADWMGNLDSFGVAWRKNDQGTDLYGVLRRTPDLVSVLTEAMFISTEAEANLLTQPEVLEAEALALADALDRWFRTADTGVGLIDGVVFRGDLGNGGGLEGCVDPQW